MQVATHCYNHNYCLYYYHYMYMYYVVLPNRQLVFTTGEAVIIDIGTQEQTTVSFPTGTNRTAACATPDGIYCCPDPASGHNAAIYFIPRGGTESHEVFACTWSGQHQSTMAYCEATSQLLTGSGNGVLRVYDASSDGSHVALINTMNGVHSGGIWSVVWLPDGSLFASAGQDRTTKVWKAKTYELLRAVTVEGVACGGCYLLSAEVVVAVPWGGTLCVFNINTGAELQRVSGHSGWVNCLQMHRQHLITSSNDRTLNVIDTNTWEVVHTFSVPAFARQICVHDDVLYAGVDSKGVYAFDLNTWEEKGVIVKASKEIYGIGVIQDSKQAGGFVLKFVD